MRPTTPSQRDERSGVEDRIGVASLELVFCLPVLLALIVGIVWLGTAVVAQTEVTVEARHKTWSKRSENSGTALLFLKDDIVSDDATKKLEVSPIFDDVEQPESSHDVMAAAWDHQQLRLDKAPNWKQYAIAAANAKTAGVQNAYVDGRNKYTQYKNQAKNIWSSLGADLIKQLTGLGDSANSDLNSGNSRSDSEKEKFRGQLQRQLNTAKSELEQARQAVNELEDDASKALKKVLKNRVERLKAEVENLRTDLKGLV